MKVSRLRHCLIITWGALLEMRRRKDLSVLGLFTGLFLLFLAVVRVVGIEHPAAGTFLLNLGLALATGGSLLMTLIATARQLPDEMEQRTLYPLLARPVYRADVLLGKWTAGVLTGLVVFGVLVVPALLLIPRLEYYAGGTLLQLLLLHPVALAMAAAIGLLCSLIMPRLPGLCSAIALTFCAGGLLRLSRHFVPFYALPDPGRINLAMRYTDGIGPLSGGAFGWLLFYGTLWTVLLLAAAMAVFQRRRL